MTDTTQQTLLLRALKQLKAWQEKYGEHNPDWLPPAGDVRLAEDIDEALSALAQQQAQGVPEGYALVPIDPTPSMLAAAIAPRGTYSTDMAHEASVTYLLMISAAPPAPKQEPAEAVQPTPSNSTELESQPVAGDEPIGFVSPMVLRNLEKGWVDWAPIHIRSGPNDDPSATIPVYQGAALRQPARDVSDEEREKIEAAIKKTEYKYFGDYAFTEEQHDAVDTLVEAARALLAAQKK